MHATTRQGRVLTVTLTALQRIPGGHPHPIIEFRYPGGSLCSSYYLPTFLSHTDGLCLQGGPYRQDIDAETVAACQHFAREAVS